MCISSPLNEEPSTNKKQPISACLWNLSECHWCDHDLNFTLLFLKIPFLNFSTTKYVTITGINASALWHYVEFIPVQLKNMQRNGRILQNLRVSVAEYVSRISTIRKAWCCYYSQEFKNMAIRKAKENMLLDNSVFWSLERLLQLIKQRQMRWWWKKEQGVKLYMRLSIIWECEHEQVLWCPLLTSKHCHVLRLYKARV